MLQIVDFSEVKIGDTFSVDGDLFEKQSNSTQYMNSFNFTKNICTIVSGPVYVDVVEEENIEWAEDE